MECKHHTSMMSTDGVSVRKSLRGQYEVRAGLRSEIEPKSKTGKNPKRKPELNRKKYRFISVQQISKFSLHILFMVMNKVPFV